MPVFSATRSGGGRSGRRGGGVDWRRVRSAFRIDGRERYAESPFDAVGVEGPRNISAERAADHVREQSGKHFDPRLVTLFLQELPKILEVRGRFLEEG